MIQKQILLKIFFQNIVKIIIKYLKETGRFENVLL